MIKIIDGRKADREEIFARRDDGASEEIQRAVRDILENVRLRGDEAVIEYTQRFDSDKVTSLRVTEEEIEAAYSRADKFFVESLNLAAENIREFHRMQVHDGFEIKKAGGIVLGQRVMPLETVGIYVPGGTASYPSTVLMNAIPAFIAGVKNIVMVTPPDREGNIPDDILAAARVAGVTHIYKMGGAQAVAALAYGTKSVPKADKIVGPGNIFVATAKRMVFGLVDIDMIAGPSEILVVADNGAEPRHLAADLLSQAEHDKLASAVLVCDSMELAEKTAAEIEKQVTELPRREIAEASIKNNGKIIVAENLDEGIDIANEIAPEHLELCVREPFELLKKVKNAGSVFLGYNSPEALGDYWAGPNHTLPTMGTAKFSSPLSVDEFVKRSSYLYYPYEELEKAKDNIASLASHEGLQAHRESVLKRFER